MLAIRFVYTNVFYMFVFIRFFTCLWQCLVQMTQTMSMCLITLLDAMLALRCYETINNYHFGNSVGVNSLPVQHTMTNYI